MNTIYGELYEINALVQNNSGELVEMIAMVAVATQNKALPAFMTINGIQAPMLIKSKVTFKRYVICAV
jgi:hypothetical protein